MDLKVRIRICDELADSIINDATGAVDHDFATDYVRQSLEREPAFGRYWYFQSPEAWRATAAQYDAFVGDRFHGGVASMQAGVPALILWRDLRVREMTELFGIPSAPFPKKPGTELLRGLVEDNLDAAALRRFETTYRERFRIFKSTIEAAGLKLSHSPRALEAVGLPAAAAV